MKVRFWGTRGSIAKAGPSTVRYGGNTSCVEVQSDSGTLVVLDIGTGAHGLGMSLMRAKEPPRAGHILITHTHWDHIQGLPFFSPLFVPDAEWHVYGPQGIGSSLRDVLAGQMEYSYFPISTEQFQAQVQYHDLVEGSFEVGDIQVTAWYLNHPGLTLGYRLEADGVVVVYATDHEPHLQRLANGGRAPAGSSDERHGLFLADADLVIHDTQYTAEEYPNHIGWGHSTMEYVVDLARDACVQRLAMFHHDPMRADDALDQLVGRAQHRVQQKSTPLDIFGAAEGHLIHLMGDPKRRIRPATPAPSALGQTLQDTASTPVLLVDMDTDEFAKILTAAVRGGDMRLVRAADPAAALEALERTHPAVVLAPLASPTVDGLALCRAIRALEDPTLRTLPVMLVCADTAIDHEAGRNAGVTEWLNMPFTEAYARGRLARFVLRRPVRWRKADVPRDEAARQAALNALNVLDTGPEERFDRLTRLAAALFGSSVAAINLIDGARQWTKSIIGTPAVEMPRDQSVCAFTILQDDIFEVTDLLRHDALADSPWVREGPVTRYYAGVPVEAPSGERVGTLCIIDRLPRRLDLRQRNLLKDIGRLVEAELARGPEPG